MFGSNSKTAPSVSTLRVQSSIYGVVLPTIRGTNRVPGKLIDWTDFVAIAESQKVGGKGLGGSNVTNYVYQAAVDLALAMTSGCVRIGSIWDGQGEYGNGQMIEEITIPSGTPGSYTPVGATDEDYSADVGVSLITTAEVWVPAYDPTSGLPQSGGAPGVGDGYYETVNVFTPMRKVSGSDPGAGQYSITGSGTSLAYLFNYADAGKPAKLVYALTVNIANEFTFFSGARPQTPWSYMAGKYPTRAEPYAGTCHVAAEAFQLGSSGTLDNLNFELVGPGVFGGGINDAGIDQCIHLVLDDPDGGCGFPTALIGDLTAAIAYCASQGLFFSPICDAQQTAASYLQDYCDAANLAVCWNDGLLKFIPYGDTPVAGNGYSYVPDLTPVYDLDDDDFIAADDEPPVKIEREDPETLANIIEIDILDRALSYNTHPIKDRDSALIFRFGQIPASPRKYDFICDPNVGAIVANHVRLRVTLIEVLSITFKLGAQYELLTLMDIVTITCLEAGWVKKPFRLKEQDEDPETGEIEWTAEPVMWGSCQATLYPKQAPGGSSTQRDAAPGSILPPIMFEAPDPLTPSGEYQLWLGLCGAALANWGGCHVYASTDGATFKDVGQQSGPSRMGMLTADFPQPQALLTVSNALVTGTALIGYLQGVLTGLYPPGTFTFTVVSTGGAIDLLMYASNGSIGPNGYIFRFDGRAGAVAGQILRVDNGTWTAIGTAEAAVNAAALAASFAVVCVMLAAGGFQIYVNGVLQWTATDATYLPTGGTYYGSEGASSQVTGVPFALTRVPVSGLDSTSILVVDLGESKGEMLSGTAEDRDGFVTLCWVASTVRSATSMIRRSSGSGLPPAPPPVPQFELISYQNAVLLYDNVYMLTSVQRGVYGTPVLEHLQSAAFLRCDDAVTKLSFPASAAGQTAYLKATSFNQYGLAEEELSAVTGYEYPIQAYFNNSPQPITSDATVDSVVASGAATVRAYGHDGVGSNITVIKQDGTSFVIPGISFAGLAFATWYWVVYNPLTQTCSTVTTLTAMNTLASAGCICLGSTLTPASGGTGSIPTTWPGYPIDYAW